jgi:NTP pyrophosphatase (non-canonical NTP hydrolase)
MIRTPIDTASRVSPELSTLIETLINQLDTDEPVTLGSVRSFIAHEMPEELDEDEALHHVDASESVIDELDELIEEFGELAAAVDFIYAFANEPLSRVIEEVVNDENRKNVPTLEDVRQAIVDGLGGRLVGEGILKEDEDDVLMPEIESLIDRYGADALAEDFLRHE